MFESETGNLEVDEEDGKKNLDIGKKVQMV